MSLFSKFRWKKGTDLVESRSPAVRAAQNNYPSAKREDFGLFPIATPKENDHSVDIIAVHGLCGHWEKTWTGDKGALWLRDFLPSKLPLARIMSYGYDSGIAFSKSASDIDDEAAKLLDRLEGERQSGGQKTKPIFFVAHGLGGIVVKKALILAHERSSHYADLSNSVRGLVFFAVPHRGADLAYWTTLAANLLEALQLGFGTNSNFLKALERNSETFSNISDQFIERGANLRIRTFYETRKIGNQLVVDRHSARLNLPNEIAVGVDADHMSVCKFDRAESQKYSPVWRAIKSIVDSTLADLHALSTSFSPKLPSLRTVCFTVPFERDLKFIGREDIITRIGQKFEVQRRVALAGIGGVGKSQIGIEYCYRFRDQHPESHVFWIHASSFDRIDQAYKDIARQLHLHGHDDPNVDKFQLVKEELAQDKHGPWLLVLDNADDTETFFPKPDPSAVGSEKVVPILDYLPRSSKGLVLITTRDERVGKRLVDRKEVITVHLMAKPEAEQLLLSKAPQASNVDKIKVAELLELLECLPLAITQAAAYISENSISIEDYLTILRMEDSQIQDLLSEDLSDPRRDTMSHNSIIRTWKVSFDQIRTQKPRAAEILSFIAVLDRQGIPKTLLRRNDEGAAEFTTALGTLQAFYLITAEEGGASFGVHRLVQTSTRRWLKLQGETDRLQEEALEILSAKFPSGDYKTWVTCESLSPHVEAVTRYDFKTDTRQLQRARLFHKMSCYLRTQGQYDLAYKKALDAFSIQEGILDLEEPDTLASMINLALVLALAGKYKAAEEMHRRVLKLCEKVLGPEHPNTLTSMSNLALVLHSQGKYDAAEKIDRRVLKLSESVLGLEHPDTLTSMSNLAEVLRSQGKYEATEEMDRRVLELRKEVLGLKHPETLISMCNLAPVLRNQGNYEAAEETDRRVLDLSETVLGLEHPDTLTSMSNLARVLHSQGKYDAAEKTDRRVLELREKVLGPEHPNTLTSIDNLALALHTQGKYEVAEEMHRRVLELRKKVLGLEHPHTLTSMNNLALVLYSQGKYEAAEGMDRRVLELSETVLGLEHPDTMTSMSNLARVLHSQGKYEAAEEMDRRVLELREKVLGLEHPNTLTSMNNLALVLRSQGKYEAVEEMHRRVLELFEKVLGLEHPDTLTSMSNLAEVLYSQGKYDAAEGMHRRGLELREKVLGLEHPETLTSINNLVVGLRSQGKYEAAEEMHQRVLELCEKVLGLEHPDTMTSMNNIEGGLRSQGKDEAGD